MPLAGMREIKLEDTFADRVARQAGCRVNVQLFHQALPVFFDSLDADTQFRSNAFVRVTLRDEVKHLEFARTEAPL